MKSFCIKTNNTLIKEFLLKSLDNIKINDVYYLDKKFKIFDNVIVHYLGDDVDYFCGTISNIITDCILFYYEPTLIKRNINYNYFYFDIFEKKLIEEICYQYISSNDNNSLYLRKDEIYYEVLKYISNNKSMILDGFVNFRLKDYFDTIDEIVVYSVNKYIVEREYNEFISLLKAYVNTSKSNIDLVHLIYTNGNESILLDDNKNMIPIDIKNINTKYLSDITFSSNDYVLNTLLSLLPKKIIVHIIGYEDEFIDSLKLIFDSKLFICRDCNICKTYRILNNTNDPNDTNNTNIKNVSHKTP